MKYVLQNHVSILAKSLIISFQYNIESVYLFYSNPVYPAPIIHVCTNYCQLKFVCCECCVLSGRGLCDELIIRPEEFYRLWCVVVCDLRGGADESLARPTSQCRRTESIVSLERGVCSCAELQVFSCYIG